MCMCVRREKRKGTIGEAHQKIKNGEKNIITAQCLSTRSESYNAGTLAENGFWLVFWWFYSSNIQDVTLIRKM